jgi:hypothetical protein
LEAHTSEFRQGLDASSLFHLHSFSGAGIPAILPPIRGDPVSYHLAYAADWANAGRIYIDPFLRFPYYANNFLLFDSAFFILKLDDYCHFLTWLCGLLTCLGILAFFGSAELHLTDNASATTVGSFPASVPNSSESGPLSGVPSISDQRVRGCTYRPFYPGIGPVCLQNIVASALRLGVRCHRRFLCRDEAYPDWSSAIFCYFTVARLDDPIARDERRHLLSSLSWRSVYLGTSGTYWKLTILLRRCSICCSTIRTPSLRKPTPPGSI